MTNETYDLLEEAVRDQIEAIKMTDSGSKEEGYAIDRTAILTNLLITVDKDNADYYDKEERRRIEESKFKDANQTERDKQKLTWGRALLEMGKVVVPVVVTMFGYDVFQKRVLKFEETGRITSTAGRDLHLPKFLK